MPAELMFEHAFMGTAEEILDLFSDYRRAGLEYFVLANGTGMAGGMAEAEARMPDFLALTEGLAKL